MLAPWKKSYDQPRQHIKKQRHYFAGKGLTSQSYDFSSSHVWMWELDHKVEHQRIDAFELWCWRRLLRVPWTARIFNKSILKEMSPEYSLEGQMLSWNSNTLATWCKELTHWKRPWCWEWLKVGGKGEDRGWAGGWHHQLDRHEFEQSLGVGDGQGGLACFSPWGFRVRHDWATELIRTLLTKWCLSFLICCLGLL